MDPKSTNEHLIHIEPACRRAGLKATHQRLKIYCELAIFNDHPSAEVLHKSLIKQIPMLSLDTVYRTLATLSRHGLIHKVETVESQARFEVIFKRHHHLICRNCREIIDFSWPWMDEAMLPDELLNWRKIDS